jgi:hypothetical protein
LSVNANVSEKNAVSIFRAEVVMLESGGTCTGSEEEKPEKVGQSRTRNDGEKFEANRKSPSRHQRGRGLGRELAGKKSALFRAYQMGSCSLCPGAHFCLSNTRVLVGKPFQFQAPVASPLHNHDHWNKPPHPTTNTVRRAPKIRRYCLTISSVDPPKTNPPSKAVSTVWKEVKSQVHTCLCLCKKSCMDNLQTR